MKATLRISGSICHAEGRIGKVEEIAFRRRILASDAAYYVTGETLQPRPAYR